MSFKNIVLLMLTGLVFASFFAGLYVLALGDYFAVVVKLLLLGVLYLLIWGKNKNYLIHFFVSGVVSVSHAFVAGALAGVQFNRVNIFFAFLGTVSFFLLSAFFLYKANTSHEQKHPF